MTTFAKALITGASSGIGKALDDLLQKKGITTLPFDSKKADLKTPEGRKSVLEAIERQEPDLVINNAGMGFYGNVCDLSTEEQKEIIDVNATALFEITRFAAKKMCEKKRGVVLNVSSVASEFPTPGMTVYGASKAFVTQFSKGIDYECRPFGVRVLVSLPGQVGTAFASRAAKKNVPKDRMSMTPERAAKEIWWQIEKGKGVHVFDLKYRALLVLFRHILPERLATQTASQLVYNSIFSRL